VEFLKPSEILKAIGEIFQKPENKINFDTLSNDWNKSSRLNWSKIPEQDSTLNKMRFGKRPKTEQQSKPLITPELEDILHKIGQLLKKHKTNFKIIITPAYNQIGINEDDLALIEKIFMKKNVFDFSGKNLLTEDKYNFSDINHFDEIVGWKMLEAIYGK
jgi:hypothetical protein